MDLLSVGLALVRVRLTGAFPVHHKPVGSSYWVVLGDRGATLPVVTDRLRTTQFVKEILIVVFVGCRLVRLAALVQPTTEPFQAVVCPLTVAVANTLGADRDVADSTVLETFAVLYVVRLQTRLQHKVADNTSGCSRADIHIVHKTTGNSLSLGLHTTGDGNLVFTRLLHSFGGGLLLLATTKEVVDKAHDATRLFFLFVDSSVVRNCRCLLDLLGLLLGNYSLLSCIGTTPLGLGSWSRGGFGSVNARLGWVSFTGTLFGFDSRADLVRSGRGLGSLATRAIDRTRKVFDTTSKLLLDLSGLVFNLSGDLLHEVTNTTSDIVTNLADPLVDILFESVECVESQNGNNTTSQEEFHKPVLILLLSVLAEHLIQDSLHCLDIVKLVALLLSGRPSLTGLCPHSSLLPTLLFLLFGSIELSKSSAIGLRVVGNSDKLVVEFAEELVQ